MTERIPALLVTDPEKSADFCVEVLGMELLEGGPHWFLGIGREQLRLIDESRADLELGQAASAGTTSARLMALDIRLLHERAELHGVVVRKQHLRRTRWGTDEFTAEDPDGNRVTFWSVSVT